MPQFHRRHVCACYVPVCLALGALCLLPALADPPATIVTPAAQTAAQNIVLQHVVPRDVIKEMHWDQPANLPAGVTQVVTLPMQNALTVTATPVGFTRIQEMIKVLDTAPRQVQVNFALAYVSNADLKAAGLGSSQYAAGLPAARFLQTLTEQKAIGASTTITTASYVSASESLFYGPATPLMFGVTPRVNSDNSLTLALDAAVPGGTVKHETHTVQSGDTMVVVKPLLGPRASGNSLLLFVVPTVFK